MSASWKRRVLRIREKIPLGPILSEVGYLIDPTAPHEQQFSCDLHGGVDHKPSARFYPRTNSTYCWACQKSRTAVDYLVEKRGYPFPKAVEALETKAGLEPLPDEGEEDAPATAPWASFDLDTPSPEARATLLRILQSATQECDLPLRGVCVLWEEYDRIVYLEDEVGEVEQAHGEMTKLLGKVRLWLGYDTPA